LSVLQKLLWKSSKQAYPVLEIAGRLSADALGVCRRVSAAAVILVIDLASAPFSGLAVT
jgi:hypothetical protein